MFKSSSQIDNGVKAYKYTNLLDGLKTDANLGSSNKAGNYDNTGDKQKVLKHNNDYAKLYKNINNYTSTDIKDLLNTKSDILPSNVLDNLRNVAILQNNYTSNTTSGITDVFK